MLQLFWERKRRVQKVKGVAADSKPQPQRVFVCVCVFVSRDLIVSSKLKNPERSCFWKTCSEVHVMLF